MMKISRQQLSSDSPSSKIAVTSAPLSSRHPYPQVSPTTSAALLGALFFIIYIQDAWEDYALLSAVHSHVRMALPTDVVFDLVRRMMAYTYLSVVTSATSWFHTIVHCERHPLRDVASGSILIRIELTIAGTEFPPVITF